MADPKLVIFDLAGTTIEDRGSIGEAFRTALSAYGLSPTDAEVAAVRGRSKRAAIERLVAPEAVEPVLATFRLATRDIWRRDGITPIAGAERILRLLRARGIRIALNTGFDRETTSLLIRSLDWETAFDAVVCDDDVSEGRPAPYMIFRAMERTGTHAVRDVAVVGDTCADLEAASNAGAGWCFGVLTGAHDRAQLEPAPHTSILDSILDLEKEGTFA